MTDLEFLSARRLHVAPFPVESYKLMFEPSGRRSWNLWNLISSHFLLFAEIRFTQYQRKEMFNIIRAESDLDRAAIRQVNQVAFNGVAEANLVDALREDGLVEVSLVAEVDGEVVGHILFSRVIIHTQAGSLDAVCLAPMSVLPSYQRQGFGTKLVKAGLDTCRRCGHKIVLVLGHPEFYGQFGSPQNRLGPWSRRSVAAMLGWR